MKHLVGRIFSIADGHYRIVDVRQLGGDALVYAEQQPQHGKHAAGDVVVTPRTAFHYGDIAQLLEHAGTTP